MSYFMKRNNQIKVRSLLVLINGKDIFYQSINAPNNILSVRHFSRTKSYAIKNSTVSSNHKMPHVNTSKSFNASLNPW